MQLPTLNTRQRKAAQLLASGLTRNETAKRLGVNPATLSLWRRNPAFHNQIESLLATQDKESIQALYALKLRAIERLSSLLDSRTPMVALRAADLILQKTLQGFPIPSFEELSPGEKAWAVMQQELERIAYQAQSKEPSNAVP